MTAVTPPLRAASSPGSAGAYDVEAVRRDFPILERQIGGRPLVYLDSAASAQRPRAVMDAMVDCYSRYYANVHRGVHTLSQESTDAYEAARASARRFLNAPSVREVVFVRGTTEGINLVAQSWGRSQVGPGDEVLITTLEHHSNIVPWQMLCRERGAILKVAPIDDRGVLLLDEFESLLSERTRLVAFGHVSNALGTVNPVKQMTELAHRAGAVVLVDGAQAAPHLRIDVQELDCDFYAFSGHKAFGPSGIGVVWGRESLLEEMPPWQGGGEMIARVSFEETVYAELPHKFEAGTPNIAGAIGLGVACDYVTDLGFDAIGAHEHRLLELATERLLEVPGLSIVGTAPGKASVVSFVLEGIHAHDIGTIVDGEGVAVRAGHHCAQPLLKRLGHSSTARASFALYNTEEEVDRLVSALHQVNAIFKRK